MRWNQIEMALSVYRKEPLLRRCLVACRVEFRFACQMLPKPFQKIIAKDDYTVCTPCNHRIIDLACYEQGNQMFVFICLIIFKWKFSENRQSNSYSNLSLSTLCI